MLSSTLAGFVVIAVLLAGCVSTNGVGGRGHTLEKPVVRYAVSGAPKSTELNPSPITPQRITVGYGMIYTVLVEGGTGTVEWSTENLPPSWDTGTKSTDGRTLTHAGRPPMGSSKDWMMRVVARVGGVASDPFEIKNGLPPAVTPLDFAEVPQVHASFGNQYFEISLPRTFLDEFDRNEDVRLSLDVRGMIAGDRIEVTYDAIGHSGSVTVRDSRNYDDLSPPPTTGASRTVELQLRSWNLHRGLAAGKWTIRFQLKDPHTRPGDAVAVDVARIRIW